QLLRCHSQHSGHRELNDGQGCPRTGKSVTRLWVLIRRVPSLPNEKARLEEPPPTLRHQRPERSSDMTYSAAARERKPTLWDSKVAVCRRLGFLSCAEQV